MNPLPSPSAVPSIRIHGTDDSSTLFEGRGGPDMFTVDMNLYPQDPVTYPCSQGLQSDFGFNATLELEDLSEFSHLSTPQQFFTGPQSYSLPYSTIVQDPNTSADPGLSPTCIGSPVPSPTPSFGSSLSPSSFYDPFSFSDSESPLSPSPDTADSHYPWTSGRLHHQSSESLISHASLIPNDSFATLPAISPGSGPQRVRVKSTPSRPGPVASKAMIEANGRRRRHPAQFMCPDCSQTFTALFSLKRHQQSHTGLRPYSCSISGCTQRFFNNSDCKRHERSRKRHKDLLLQ